jgi:tetratricopeptide (TPR) repeat protein
VSGRWLQANGATFRETAQAARLGLYDILGYHGAVVSGVADGRLCSYTLAAALGLSALAGGAVHLPILALYTLLVVTSGLLSCRVEATGTGVEFQSRRKEAEPSRSVDELRWRVRVGVGVWWALALVCWLQVLPIPMSWLEAGAPVNADIWSRALRPFGEPPPQWASLSLAPGRTLVEALKVASYGVVFAVSARLAARDGVRGIAWIIFSCALLVGLVTAAHQVLGASALYGLYRPLHAYVVGPILNFNSLAGYLNLGLFAGLGLLLRRRGNTANPLIAVGLVVILAEIILCQSRGATACLLSGLALLLVLPGRGRNATGSDPAAPASWQRGVLLSIVAVAALMAVLALRRADWNRLTDASLEKLDLFTWVSRLAREHGAGVGRGAFGSVFFTYEQQGKDWTYDHAENLLLQWASEWGWAVAGSALVALGWALRPLLNRRVLHGRSTRLCLLVGCSVLVLQNLVDLGLEIPALAALLACALGGLVGALRRDSQRSALVGPSLAPGRRFVRAGSAITSVALLLAASWGGETLPRLRQQLFSELSASRGLPAPAFWSDLRAAMLDFPADPYFPLLGSRAALVSGKNGVPWIARALERAPTYGAAHLERARILGARGAIDQALGALRRAVELDPTRASAAVQLGLSWRVSPEALQAAAPTGKAGAPLLRALAQLVPDPAARIRLLEEATERDPSDADTHYLVTSELLRDLGRQEHAVFCTDREACLRSARSHADKSERPGDPRVVILQAQIVAEQGERAGAEAQLWRSCEHFPGHVGCAEALVTLAVANESPRLSDAVKRFVAVGCSSEENCSRTHGVLGDLFMAVGLKNTALLHFEQAARHVPSAGSLQRLAKLSRELGHQALADAAIRRAQAFDSRRARRPTDRNEPWPDPPVPDPDPSLPGRAP